MGEKQLLLKQQKHKIFIAWVGILIATALPLMVDYCPEAAQLPYQLLRMEQVKEGLQAGCFLVAMPADWQEHLNATGVEGNLLWIFPAILRLFGMSVQGAYRMFLLIIQVITIFASYYFFRCSFGENRTGLLGCMLYSWTPWYIDALYGRAAIGEALAYAFVPLVCCGFFKICSQQEQKQKWKSIMLSAFGLSMLLQASLGIFCAVMAFALLTGVFFAKKVFRKASLMTMAKSFLLFLVWNLWYLISVAGYAVKNKDIVKYLGSTMFQQKGLYLSEFLMTFWNPGTSYQLGQDNFSNGAARGMGFALALVLVMVLWMLYSGQLQWTTRTDRVEVKVLLLGILGMLVSCSVFPWDMLRRSSLFQVFSFSMSSPGVFVIIPIIIFSYLACRVDAVYGKRDEKSKRILYECILAGVCLVCSQYLIDSVLLDRTALRMYDAADIPQVSWTNSQDMILSGQSTMAQWGTLVLGVISFAGMTIYSIWNRRAHRNVESRMEQ